VHPLQVESVAWIAERKNVLSGFFWLLTMAAYARYADRPRIGRYLAVIVCVVLGLMSKATVVTLPFALLLLDFWPLDRIRWRSGNDLQGSTRPHRRRYSPLLLLAEKVPMFILAGCVAAAAYLIQQAGGILPELARMPLKYRLANATISYFTYIEKLVWPSGLAPFYPHPGSGFSVPKLIVSIVGLIIISACCLYFGRKRKYLITGWLWHLGLLIPVIGLIQSGAQARADRYMYTTMIGPLVIVAWGVSDLLRRRPQRRVLANGVHLIAVASLADGHGVVQARR